jgi:hypothetical protein
MRCGSKVLTEEAKHVVGVCEAAEVDSDTIGCRIAVNGLVRDERSVDGQADM